MGMKQKKKGMGVLKKFVLFRTLKVAKIRDEI